jgi:trk system potassium uptake protein TrkH
MKVFRFQILYEAAKVQIAQLRHPHGVFIPSYNGKPVNEKAFLSVLAFFALYILCYGALAIGLALCELDWLTSVSGSAAIMGNVGPALGEAIGPAGNFSSLPDGAKWGMLVGRLELLTIIILFTPGFWRG